MKNKRNLIFLTIAFCLIAAMGVRQIVKATAGLKADSVTVTGLVSAGTLSGNGAALTAVTGTDATKVPLAGGTMTGTLNVYGSTTAAVNIDPVGTGALGTLLSLVATGATDAVYAQTITTNNASGGTISLIQTNTGPNMYVQINKTTSTQKAVYGTTNGAYSSGGVYGVSTTRGFAAGGSNTGYVAYTGTALPSDGVSIYAHAANANGSATVMSANTNGYGRILEGWSGVAAAETSKWSVHRDGTTQQAASTYINFGSATGTASYGFYDNSGTIQVKNSGGAWNNIGGATHTFVTCCTYTGFNCTATGTVVFTAGQMASTTCP